MIVIATTLLGGGYGAYLARKRGGDRYDIAQYAAIFAMICALIGLFITIFIHRSL